MMMNYIKCKSNTSKYKQTTALVLKFQQICKL